MLADRRVSSGDRVLQDNARKVVFLETADAVAMIGYSGLGSTVSGTEPSDWMGRVLRGRNFPLEESIWILAEAMERELPEHLLRLPRGLPPLHLVLINAFVGDEARLYSITLSAGQKPPKLLVERHIKRHGRPPRMAIAGSGAGYLWKTRARGWKRQVLKLVRAYDEGRIAADGVAHRLAQLNFAAFEACKTVGPRCGVFWRNRRSARDKEGGGNAHFSNVDRDAQGAPYPTIVLGHDLNAHVDAMTKYFREVFAAKDLGDAPPDPCGIHDAIEQLPAHPDEKIR
jgi:hypothetical protein